MPRDESRLVADAIATRAGEGRARRARPLAWGLQTTAALSAAVLASRSGFPTQAGLLLLLVAAAAASVHQQALFSGELSLTAEASVVVCAVVLFRDDAPLLAPVLVGLACGWLDSFHWSSRAWVPMAFNSGSRALEALLGALAFGAVVGAQDDRGARLVVAAVAASLAVATAAIISYAVLVVVRDGARVFVAARTVLRLDALSFLLALYGGIAGLIGVATYAWIGALAVFPPALVPYVRLVRHVSDRTRVRVVSAVAGVATVGAFLAALVAGGSSVAVTSALAILGAAAGVEVVGAFRRGIAPAFGAVVVAGAVAVAPHALDAVLVVAGAGVAGAWWIRARPWTRSEVIASSATIVTAVAVGVVVRDGASGIAAAGVFALAVLVVSPRLATATSLGWALPVVAVGATAAELSRWWGAAGALAAVSLVLVVVAFATAWSGPLPWSSRYVTPLARTRGRGAHRTLWAVLGIATLVPAGCGIAFSGSSTRAVAVVLVAVGAEVLAAVALARIRLWLFRPGRRRVQIALTLVIVGVAWWCGSNATDDTALVVACVVAAAAFVVGYPTLALADRAEADRRRGVTSVGVDR